MITVRDALGEILAHARPSSSPQSAPLERCAGRILAECVTATRDQPPTDVSAMDGYAVRASDAPGEVRIVGESAAGHAFDGALELGEAVRISTGAPIPAGADVVLIQEDAVVNGDRLTVPGLIAGRHIRRRGGDFSEGATSMTSGRRLSAGDLTLAAALGRSSLRVASRPDVAILACGDELAAPGARIGTTQIYESASFGVAALADAWGATATRPATSPDEADAIRSAMASAIQNSEIVILIGGASAGPHDLGRAALAHFGVAPVFHKVAMKPGKPTWLGVVDGRIVLGLPGNPAAALVCARLFLAPLIERVLGCDPPLSRSISTARLDAPLPATGDREEHLRAVVRTSGNGALVATPLSDQDSSLVSVLSASNALIERPQRASEIFPGEVVTWRGWTPDFQW